MTWITMWSSWQWLILGFLLLIGEILIPGVFLLWFGIAGLCIALITALIPISTPVSWILFAILAFTFSLLWWHYQHIKDQADNSHSQLNQRGLAMLGRTGKVISFNSNHIGRGQFGDTTWRIQGENLANGDTIKVIAVEGITLQVEKVIA